MGLTWRDLVSSAAILAMVLAYYAHMSGAHLVLLSSAWTASAVELVLATICAVSAAFDLHTTPLPWHGVIFRRITTVLGSIAFVAGMAGLVANSARAIEVLVVTMGFLWFTATTWHVLAIGSDRG
jgi:hypothetical protein